MTELVPTIYMVQTGVDLAGGDAREDHQQPHQPKDLNTVQSSDSDNQCVDTFSNFNSKCVSSSFFARLECSGSDWGSEYGKPAGRDDVWCHTCAYWHGTTREKGLDRGKGWMRVVLVDRSREGLIL